MKKRFGWLLVGSALLFTGAAFAQHRPTPIPSGDSANAADEGGTHHLPANRKYPMSAANYGQLVDFYISVIRNIVKREPRLQQDFGKWVVHVRECQSVVASDNYVTAREGQSCLHTQGYFKPGGGDGDGPAPLNQ